MTYKNNPVARKSDLVVQQIMDEVLIYDLKIHKAFHLNETSTLVWHLSDGNNSADEISKAISTKFNALANEDLVWLAIDQLKKQNLLDNSSELESKFDGLSRREVIKRAGAGLMIALPVVATLAAPTIANAASLVCTGQTGKDPAGCPCNGGGNCISKTCTKANVCF